MHLRYLTLPMCYIYRSYGPSSGAWSPLWAPGALGIAAPKSFIGSSPKYLHGFSPCQGFTNTPAALWHALGGVGAPHSHGSVSASMLGDWTVWNKKIKIKEVGNFNWKINLYKILWFLGICEDSQFSSLFVGINMPMKNRITQNNKCYLHEQLCPRPSASSPQKRNHLMGLLDSLAQLENDLRPGKHDLQSGDTSKLPWDKLQCELAVLLPLRSELFCIYHGEGACVWAGGAGEMVSIPTLAYLVTLWFVQVPLPSDLKWEMQLSARSTEKGQQVT